jgi:hypothetical protein
MKAAELRAVTMRLDVLRDIMVELVAALPPDRAAGFAEALGNRLNGRICDMEIDERSDNAMVSDLAPVFAALNQRPHETQLTWRDTSRASRLSKASACDQHRLV